MTFCGPGFDEPGTGLEGVRLADVAVVTDSTCGLPVALAGSLDITTVSLYYDLGGGWLRESEFDCDFGSFFAKLDASKTVATTSEPAVEDFVVVLSGCYSSTVPWSRC